MQLSERIKRWLRLPLRVQTTTSPPQRARTDHFVILDGTMSSLAPGQETNAGLTYRLLCEMAPTSNLSIRYEKGVQWRRWRDILDVIEGRGINRQIIRAYGFLASRYRAGDRIFLIGYSRGAYAVRSLGGVIDMIGLLRPEHATVRNIRQVYRHYQAGAKSEAARVFSEKFCYPRTEIEMVGVWDTVKSLGLNLPVVRRYALDRHNFHSDLLGQCIRHGFHALAMNENRLAYAPVMWESRPDWQGRLEQVWFRGTHGDVGGHLGGYEPARPLANIPLVWMLQNIEFCDVRLPDDWQDRFVCDVDAPSVGTFRGWGKLLLRRHKRVIGQDPSESIHVSVLEQQARFRSSS